MLKNSRFANHAIKSLSAKKELLVEEYNEQFFPLPKTYTYYDYLILRLMIYKYQLKYDYYNFLILFLSQNVFLTGSLFVVFMLCSIFLLYFHFTLLLLLPLAVFIYFFGELISKNNSKRVYYFNISFVVFLLSFQILLFDRLISFTLISLVYFLILWFIFDFSFLLFIERFVTILKNLIMWGVKGVKKTKKSA